MSMIDPTARIEDGAVIGAGTSIGPYCVIGPHVVIGADCKLMAHVSVAGLEHIPKRGALILASNTTPTRTRP